MTHDELVKRAVRWLRNTKKCHVVFAELVTCASSIPDALGWCNSGKECHLVECKMTRPDFRRDKNKLSHQTGCLPGSHRWYMTPPGLVQPHELPIGWGLLEVHEKIVRVAVQSESWRMVRNRGEELTILLSAVRRHQVGAEWRNADAKFRPLSEKD